MAKSNKITPTGQDSVEELKRLLAEKDAEIANLQEQLQTESDDLQKHWGGIYGRLDMQLLEETYTLCKQAYTMLVSNTNGAMNLSPAQRRRLQGAGIRRYGLIEKMSDLIPGTPYSTSTLITCIQFLELIRNITVMLEAALRTANDLLLSVSDDAYRMTLIIYRQIQLDARRGIPLAQSLNETLRTYFRPMGKHTGNEPSEAEIERDVKALLHGTKDGEIIIKNERPEVMKGKRTVVDETHKEKAAWKESESGEIK